ncbi:hypothetical protein E4U27_000170 [Claviceps purpurea]|nr:hypothetical protein E4U27_000170 [Claviceps purpurea]
MDNLVLTTTNTGLAACDTSIGGYSCTKIQSKSEKSAHKASYARDYSSIVIFDFLIKLRAGEKVAVFLIVAKNAKVLVASQDFLLRVTQIALKLHASYGKNKDDLVKAKDTLAKCKHYEFS